MRRTKYSAAPPRPDPLPGARFVYSILALVAPARVPVIASQLGLDCATTLDLAVEVEQRAVPSAQLLALLSDDELRAAASAWALNADRTHLISCFANSISNIA